MGLIQLTGEKRVRVSEVLSAPLREPVDGLRLEVIGKLNYSQCTICDSLFESYRPGTAAPTLIHQEDTMLDLQKAVQDYKGVVYWLGEQGSRSWTDEGDDRIYHRRYICPDCVTALFAATMPPSSQSR